MSEENIAKKVARSIAEYEAHIKGPALRLDTTRLDITELRGRVDAIEAFLQGSGIKDSQGRSFTPGE